MGVTCVLFLKMMTYVEDICAVTLSALLANISKKFESANTNKQWASGPILLPFFIFHKDTEKSPTQVYCRRSPLLPL